MASLEELLAMEGFKKGKSKARPVPSRAVSMPLYHSNQQSPSARNGNLFMFRRGRAKSDVNFRKSESGVFPESGRSSRSKLARRESSHYDKSREAEDFEVRSYSDVQEADGSNGRPQIWRPDSVDEPEGGSDEIQEIEEPRDKHTDRTRAIYSFHKKYNNDMFKEEKQGGEKMFPVRPSFNGDHQGRRRSAVKTSDSEPALDRAAILAVISILTGYLRRFFKDEDFRASIRDGCEFYLGIAEAEEGHSGVIGNLREAMGTVERVVQEVRDPMLLKKASLKLSVITGLSSKELNDEYTSGIGNSILAACAHIYLSVIYKLQKKDRVAAKHLLQVFCELPNQARVTLLPVIWEHLFYPHFSHLREWYDKEVESISCSPGTMKLNLLEKVYNNAVDIGTYQFAVYYKEWLMEESASPTLPSIQIPSLSFPGISREDCCLSRISTSPHSSHSSHPIVSKKLYDSVFSHSKKFEVANETRGIEKEESEEEFVQLTRHGRSSRSITHGNANIETYSPEIVIHEGDQVQENQSSCSSSDAFASPDGEAETLKGASRSDIPEIQELDSECNSRPADAEEAKENEHGLTLKKLAQGIFQPLESKDRYNNINHADSPLTDSYENNLQVRKSSYVEDKKSVIAYKNSHPNPFVSNLSTKPYESLEDIDRGSKFSIIPNEFICPITHQLFRDPVTLETGQTFERVIIEEWFEKGKRTCPITGRSLECSSVPSTNFLLKRLIDGWKSEYCRNLLVFATQTRRKPISYDSRSMDESALFIIEKLLTNFGIQEEMENAKHLISIGGLHFLLQRLDLGNLEEKTRVVSLILLCIKADGSCRSYLTMNIKPACILDLLHSKQASARTNAILLLIELICLNRRTAITSFVNGLQIEAIVNATHAILIYLQSAPPEEKAFVAVLLLHLDLMIEPRRYSIYREEAVDSITIALKCCLSDEKVIPNTRRALLVLGGHFSSSGEILTETRLLKQAGFYNGFSTVPINSVNGVDEVVSGEEEAKEREEWSRNVVLVLLSNGRRSFVDILSTCLGSESPDLVRTCLTTVAWLSRALALLSVKEIHLSAFSALVPQLKEILENDQETEHRVLASLSLLNFSNISDCRLQLMTYATDICDPLKNLVGVTWTAEHLYTAIVGQCL